jgi:hypothetical protein
MILVIGSEYVHRYSLNYRIRSASWDYITNVLIISRHDFV